MDTRMYRLAGACIACYLFASITATTTAMAFIGDMGPEPTPDPSLKKGKCAGVSRVRVVCEMCGLLGLGITTEECCMHEGAHDVCKDGVLMLMGIMEETSNSMKVSDTQEKGGSAVDFDDMFPVKRYSPLFSPISWEGNNDQREEEKRGNIFRNYNRMWYKGGKRAGNNKVFSNYNRMWYKG